MKIIINSWRSSRAVCALLLAVLALACGKEGQSGVERRRGGATEAAAASVSSAAVASSAAPEVAPAPPPTPGLVRTSAEQLLAAIRARGKKATLVNAWASWCGPCRRELPMLQALAANLKPQGVEVVLVSVDEAKDEPKALSYLKDNGITLESYLVDGSIGDFKAGINPNWPGMLPASFLFDGAGRLTHFWGGEAFESELVPVIEAFLAGKPIAAETRYGLAPGKME